MPLPTEPIGSIPRPKALLDAMAGGDAAALAAQLDAALKDTIAKFEETGSPVITDGEQAKSSFLTYPLDGLANLAPDGVTIPFEDGHARQLPRLTAGPFRYQIHADSYLKKAQAIASVPVKQAVIAPSAMSLLYPEAGIEGYSREAFIADLVAEAAEDIRGCLAAGAHKVQLDFTEGRLAVKLDPSKGLLKSFVELNNTVLAGFSDDERARIGIHTCPGGDHDSTHSADVDYLELMPLLFEITAGNFYIQMASEADKPRVLGIIREHAKPNQNIFIGVIDPNDPRIETPEEVRDRMLEAADFISPERLGSTDDCGFSPFADDVSTAREVAFAKIRARVEGTRLASEKLGV